MAAFKDAPGFARTHPHVVELVKTPEDALQELDMELTHKQDLETLCGFPIMLNSRLAELRRCWNVS